MKRKKPDPYKGLRAALAAGPTKGPWKSMPVRSGYYIQSASVPAVVVDTTDEEGRYGAIANEADAALIAAADPDTIAALLRERDALRAAVKRVVEIADSDPFQTVGFTVEHVVDLRAALADGEAAPAGVDVKWACTRSEFT